MPRYRYVCHQCNTEFVAFHQWEETQDVCLECGATDISKLFNNSFVTKKNIKADEKVGNLTKQYIETNKEILEDLKKEAKQETYE